MTEKHGTDIQETLAERELQHGPFAEHARIEKALFNIVANNNLRLTDVQHCGLSMIMHKIARILNCGNNHPDTWHDIAGYALLVEQNILDEQMES